MTKYAGFTHQEIYCDLEKNIAVVNKVPADLDVDAVSGAPSLWWAALHDAVGAKCLKFAGNKLDKNQQFQYVEANTCSPATTTTLAPIRPGGFSTSTCRGSSAR